MQLKQVWGAKCGDTCLYPNMWEVEHENQVFKVIHNYIHLQNQNNNKSEEKLFRNEMVWVQRCEYWN